MAFGALTFVNTLYFKFITRLENVFVQCLSYEHLIIYGSFLVERIKNALLNDKIVLSEFALFIHEDVSHIIMTKILSLLLTCYSRMRGKDFCMKLLTKQSSLKVTTRATMAVLANPKHYAKERSKNIINLIDDDDSDKSDHNRFQEIFINVTDDLVEEDDS